MSNIIESCNWHGIQYAIRKSLFQGEYSYRIRLVDDFKNNCIRHAYFGTLIETRKEFLEELEEFKNRILQKIEYIEHHNAFMKHLDNIPVENVDIARNANYDIGSVFFRNMRDVIEICEKYPDAIQEVCGTINENHSLALKHGKVIKDRLFYNRFRYRIVYRASKDFDYAGILQKLKKNAAGFMAHSWFFIIPFLCQAQEFNSALVFER